MSNINPVNSIGNNSTPVDAISYYQQAGTKALIADIFSVTSGTRDRDEFLSSRGLTNNSNSTGSGAIGQASSNSPLNNLLNSLLGATGINNGNSNSNTNGINVLAVDFLPQEQARYDLDGNGLQETIHSTVTEAGIKVAAPNTDVQVAQVTNSPAAAVQELQAALTKAQNKEIDAIYLAIGFDIPVSEYGNLIGNTNLTIQDILQDPQIRTDIRQAILNSPNSPELAQMIQLIEQIQAIIPVYVSAGNNPSNINALVFAEGNNVQRIGSQSSYSSLLYDRAIQTDYNWTKYSTGWDINDDQQVDLLFNSNTTEGSALTDGSKRPILGGTSLGVALALGEDIAAGNIIDQAANTNTA